MKKVEEYLQHAAQCRALASRGVASARQQLQKLAETWERLAAERKARIARQKRIAESEAAAEINRRD